MGAVPRTQRRRGRAGRRTRLAAASAVLCALFATQSAACALRGFGGIHPASASRPHVGPTAVPEPGAMPCHAAAPRADSSAAGGGGEDDGESCRRHCELYAEILPGHAETPPTPRGPGQALPDPAAPPVPVPTGPRSAAVRRPPALAPPLARTAVLRL